MRSSSRFSCSRCSAVAGATALPVNKLTVKSAAASVGARELLPNYRERVPGNAAISYHRHAAEGGASRSRSAAAAGA
jgi:hypothetical protein